MLNIKVKRIHPNATLPTRATSGSACYDIYSCEKTLLAPTDKVIIGTGLAFEIPKGYAIDIRPRSGLASKGLIIMNSPGTLDNDYRGELKVAMINLTGEHLIIHRNDRIAQIRPFEVERIDFMEVDELSETDRGEGGFGSTGN